MGRGLLGCFTLGIMTFWMNLAACGLLMAFLLVCCTAVCCRASVRCRGFPAWVRLVLLLGMCRIGEATNPGPLQQQFTLGTFNPSGLNGKAPFIVSQLPMGNIWAVSETHLSSRALSSFRSSMRFANGPYRYCIGGHPVPSQNHRMFQ